MVYCGLGLLPDFKRCSRLSDMLHCMRNTGALCSEYLALWRRGRNSVSRRVMDGLNTSTIAEILESMCFTRAWLKLRSNAVSVDIASVYSDTRGVLQNATSCYIEYRPIRPTLRLASLWRLDKVIVSLTRLSRPLG